MFDKPTGYEAVRSKLIKVQGSDGRISKELARKTIQKIIEYTLK